MAILLCMPYQHGGALSRMNTKTTGALWTCFRSTTSKITKNNNDDVRLTRLTPLTAVAQSTAADRGSAAGQQQPHPAWLRSQPTKKETLTTMQKKKKNNENVDTRY